ncbi:MAG: hypothetical protein AAFN13_15675 [Bacteroidota bacterium]
MAKDKQDSPKQDSPKQDPPKMLLALVNIPAADAGLAKTSEQAGFVKRGTKFLSPGGKAEEQLLKSKYAQEVTEDATE